MTPRTLVLTDTARFDWLDSERAAQVRGALIARTVRWAVAAAPGAALVAGEAGDLEAALDGTGAELLAGSAQAALDKLTGPVVVVTANMPWLHPTHARAAFGDLATGCDVTIGPTTSGGWYLLGMREPRAELLEARGRAGLGPLLAAGLHVAMLRPERALAGAQDAAALLADPLADPDLIRALDDDLASRLQ